MANTKLDGYVIIAENGKYIHTTQTGEREIDVYTTEWIDDADLFTKEGALTEAKNIRNNTGKFDYWVASQPVGIVKVTKEITIGQIESIEGV